MLGGSGKGLAGDLGFQFTQFLYLRRCKEKAELSGFGVALDEITGVDVQVFIGCDDQYYLSEVLFRLAVVGLEALEYNSVRLEFWD